MHASERPVAHVEAEAALVDGLMRSRGMVCYRTWPVTDAYAALVPQRWEEVKALGNEAVHAGEFELAIAHYTDALAITDCRQGVHTFFDALDSCAEDSAAQRLAGARADIEPIVLKFMPGPVDGPHGARRPNRPAAICLSNRACALIKAGRLADATLDARAAVATCPEYLQGHYRLKQALTLVAQDSTEALVVNAKIQRFMELTARSCYPELASLGAGLPGSEVPWSVVDTTCFIGAVLARLRWVLSGDYRVIYEQPRAHHWRHAALSTCLVGGSCPGLRVHMFVSAIDSEAFYGEVSDEHWLAVRLLVTPPRPEGPSNRPTPCSLPSIDYKYLPMAGKADDGTTLPVQPRRRAYGERLACALRAEIAELPFLTSLSFDLSLSSHAEEVREALDEHSLLAPRLPGRVLDGLDVCYTAGRCIKHRRFGYRGVVVRSADHTCQMHENWCRQMGVDGLRRGRYQPWYHVLVDERDRPGAQCCYVCHDNIELWFPVGFDGPLGPISHPEVHDLFTGWHTERGVYRVRF